jgi:hypothetical protein
MAKRASLTTFAPSGAPATTSNVHKLAPQAEASGAKQYHKLNVYLTEQEVRTIKLIALDTGKRYSDVAAAAIREWLAKNGHAR